MALSFYSNHYETMDPLINSTLTDQLPDPQFELVGALLGLYDPIEFSIDSLFDEPPPQINNNNPSSVINSTHHHLIPSFSDPSIISLPIIVEDFDFCRCPKRPRSCNDLYYQSGGNLGNNAGVDRGSNDNGEDSMMKRSLSAQSVAARERRKRISEKTQELGKLIPGDNKMNTAEMFSAAFKYVKFLQAQVGVLCLMGSMQDCKGSGEVGEDLQVMLKSQVIQEKLSSEENCIVPKEMVDALAKDTQIRSSPFVSRDLDRFVESVGSKSTIR